MCSQTRSHDDGSEPDETNEDLDGADADSAPLSDPEGSESAVPAVDVPAPDQITELYGVCIDYVKRALGLELDFTDETLPVLDHYVSMARKLIEDRRELAQILQNAIGAYFGELVRRRVNGYWMLPNPDVHNWRVCARHVFLSLNPIGVACEALAQSDEHDGPSAEMRLAPEDQALVAERLAKAPPVPEGQYYLLSTRLEAIDITVETLRLAMQQGGHSSVQFDLEDYESLDY